ncbi:LysE family translocator [Desulfovibrio sp. SGI.169]|uniref:LysE family translocator n=1 Tax=Desulfovibrio sp. SGI.169 TaxID=3420561 RepID=UPI003D0689FF
MIALDKLLLFVPLTAMLVVLPGPDFALIAKTSLLDGRPQGQAAACGVALGIVIHTCAAMLGISAIISQSVFLFGILKYMGAAYLLWLGVQALRQSRAPGRKAEQRAADAPRPAAGPARAALWRAFRQGLLTNVLNPKAVLIFLTFLPQFMNPRMPLGPQFLVLGGITAALCLCWYVPLASLLGHARGLFESFRFQRWLRRCAGVVFIAFSLRLAAARND